MKAMKAMKVMIKKLPFFGNILQQLYWSMSLSRRNREQILGLKFTRSANYWEERYTKGGNSGAGSYGQLAEFKAEVLNLFVADHGVRSVIEFGSGDGNQLKLASYPSYIGIDVSTTAISRCKEIFQSDTSKHFLHTSEYRRDEADLSLSLDVLYHLVEDEAFEIYMNTLFNAARNYVIIFSSNSNDNTQSPPHVRHRRFSSWVEQSMQDWKLVQHIPNKHPYKGDSNKGSFADFYIYERQ